MGSSGRCSAAGRWICLTMAIVLYSCSPADAAAASNQNFTVGDDQGWAPPATKDAYQKWAQGKNFSVGDFLLFSYPSESHNVVVTHNETVYTTCDWLDAQTDDTETWGQVGNSTYSAVPLEKTGMTYFFCGAEPIEDHCQKGMKFAINVSNGAGLPPSLIVPAPAPANDDTTPADDSTPSGDDTPQFDQLPPPPPPPPSSSHFASACFHSVLLIQAVAAAILILIPSL